MQASLIASPFARSEALHRAVTARATALDCRLVTSAAERDLHMRIRNVVFVGEQAIFTESDRDAHDADPATLHVLGICGGVAAGTVRLYPGGGSGGSWTGDRLAVLPEFRAQGLGKPLVRFAVRTAAERGGNWMNAHIQVANVSFFERLGWKAVGDPEPYCGRPHQAMVIDLRAPTV
jgi:putative N-acetyltransferase (TIGR04045 family)